MQVAKMQVACRNTEPSIFDINCFIFRGGSDYWHPWRPWRPWLPCRPRRGDV